MDYLREMADGGYRPETVGSFHRYMVPHLVETAGVPREAAILDIGAGQGHGLLPLRERGWTNLIAADRDDFNFARFEDEFGFGPLDESLGLGDCRAVIRIGHWRGRRGLARADARILRRAWVVPVGRPGAAAV